MTRLLLLSLFLALAGCGGAPDNTVTMSASAVGPEAEILRKQIARFEKEHPGIRVAFQDVPDASDQRHQLYAQYLNAHTGDPDILQLDVVWTPEFAGAGWILQLDDRFEVDTDDFFPATIRANQWQGKLYGLPWFADVGMLYYRTDLVANAPETFAELNRLAESGLDASGVEFGILWQGEKYEGLVCVFLEHLGGFGGRILDDEGRVVVDSEEAVRALKYMREAIYKQGVVPRVALEWQEEETRLHFQNGHAVFLRNWPYCAKLLSDPKRSKVAGKFGVTVMPHAEGGSSTAALGGSQLAINAWTDQPEAAWKVLAYLTHPDQMLERAIHTGQFPPRRSVYDRPELAKAFPIEPDVVRRLVEQARPRPVTPVYTELSEVLQIWLHRCLVGDLEPREALQNAAREMNAMLVKYELLSP